MTSRLLGGKPVNPVGLGCMSLSWAYGPPLDDESAGRLLNLALDLGYDHLDTARIYGLGENERIIGKYLSARRKEYYLTSKTGIIIDGEKRRVDCRPETIRAGLETSLKLLQTDHIDLYYLHRPDANTPIEESVGELSRLIKEGKIGGYGLSEMSSATLRRAAAVHPVAAMQTEYSPWTRNPEIAVLEACRELGTTFVAFSPVGRGALARGVSDPALLAKGDLRPTMPRFSPENWPHNARLILRFEQVAEDHGVTPAQLALSWVLSRGEHVVVIPGTANQEHLRENIARGDWELPDAAQVAIDEIFPPEAAAGHRYADAMRNTVTTEEFA